MQLVDIGANLTHESFSHDFEEVLGSAVDVGLVHMMLTGTDLHSSQAARLLAEQRPGLLSSTVGVHPHHARAVSDQDMHSAAELAQETKVVAIGETGLDFNRNFSPAADQLRIFQQHLELAVDCQKPLFLHQRDAHQDFLPLLQKYRSRISGGVVHCFTDNEQALQDYIELDMYIGITGWVCDERRGKELQRLVSQIPDERLLIESDAPYLLPRTLRPRPKTRRNEPRYLPAVLGQLALSRDQSEQHLAAVTTANARRLFQLPGSD